LITTASLKTQSWQDLADLAKRKGLAGYSSMRKDQLVRALLRAASKPKPASKSGTRKSKKLARPASLRKTPAAKNGHAHSNGRSSGKINGKANGKTHGSPKTQARPTARQAKIAAKIQQAQAHRDRMKDLSSTVAFRKSGRRAESDKDRLVLLVRDSYWIQACWNVTRQSVQRAEAALAEHWHTARPTLRLLEVDAGSTTSTAERVTREIEVHGGVTNWYIDVANPPRSFRADLGYKSANGKFFAICRSNSVTTPAPDSSDAIDENWTDVAENYERVYAMSGGYSEDNNSGELQEVFEERLRRPMHNPMSSQFGVGAERVLNRHRELEFNVDAEMILYGRTKADARVTLAGDPVKLRSDGTFTIRLAMPDKRQVLPVVASSSDGVEQRTIVIAVERNTKVLEPMMKEAGE
jgi:hypothetical protein